MTGIIIRILLIIGAVGGYTIGELAFDHPLASPVMGLIGMLSVALILYVAPNILYPNKK